MEHSLSASREDVSRAWQRYDEANLGFRNYWYPILVSRSLGNKKPASVMVWAAITSNGKTPLHFVEPGAKINKEYYCKQILKGTLLPWATQHFGD